VSTRDILYIEAIETCSKYFRSKTNSLLLIDGRTTNQLKLRRVKLIKKMHAHIDYFRIEYCSYK